MRGGGRFTEDNDLMTSIVKSIEFCDTLHKKYNPIKISLITTWIGEIPVPGGNNTESMSKRDENIVEFINTLLNDLITDDDFKSDIKTSIGKQYEKLLLLNNSKNKEYKIKDLMNKYDNLIAQLNYIKTQKQPKPKIVLSKKDMEKRVAESQKRIYEKTMQNEINTQITNNRTMAEGLAKTEKQEYHKLQMETEEYKKKFDSEIQFIEKKRAEYTSIRVKIQVDYMNLLIEEWYSYTEKAKSLIIEKLKKN